MCMLWHERRLVDHCIRLHWHQCCVSWCTPSRLIYNMCNIASQRTHLLRLKYSMARNVICMLGILWNHVNGNLAQLSCAHHHCGAADRDRTADRKTHRDRSKKSERESERSTHCVIEFWMCCDVMCEFYWSTKTTHCQWWRTTICLWMKWMILYRLLCHVMLYMLRHHHHHTKQERRARTSDLPS